jgi:hypothetical protein
MNNNPSSPNELSLLKQAYLAIEELQSVEAMAEYLESEIEEHLKQESVYPANGDPKQSSPKSDDSPELAAASTQDLSEEEEKPYY